MSNNDKYKNGKIDEAFYNKSNYFEEKGEILTDLNTRFQKYRISSVLKIYNPKPTDRVLDLGCGWGTFDFVLSPKVSEIVGLDFSSKSVEICNKLLKDKNLGNIKFICANATETGLESESFDLIISADLFEHIYPDDFELVMDECKRLLKPGGKLAIWTPNRGHFIEILKNHNILIERDISHVDYKSMDRLIKSCEKRGLKIINKYYAESHIPLINIFEKALLKIIPIFRRRIAILAEKIE